MGFDNYILFLYIVTSTWHWPNFTLCYSKRSAKQDVHRFLKKLF